MPAPSPGLTARARVARVVDGDTLDVIVEWPARIRLTDCWAPEPRGADKILGERASAALSRMLPEGSPVVVVVRSAEAGNLGDLLTFGRVLGEVWRPGDDQSLNDAMVDCGFATREKP